MKTLLKISSIVTLFTSLICCTNSTNKPNTSFFESVIISTDTTTTYTPNYSIDDTSCIVWKFKSINNEALNNYIYENSPFLTFSLDSTFVLINTGCNYYIGECNLENNIARFKKIKIKEEICPVGALEREIVYMLESSNHYILNDDNFILFTNDYPIGLLTKDTINCDNIYP